MVLINARPVYLRWIILRTKFGHFIWDHNRARPYTSLFVWEWGSEIQFKCPNTSNSQPSLLSVQHSMCASMWKNVRRCMSCGKPQCFVCALFTSLLLSCLHWPTSSLPHPHPHLTHVPSTCHREFFVTNPSNCLKRDYDSHTGCERVQNKSACHIYHLLIFGMVAHVYIA